jgi:hypothetical protein
MIHIGRWMIVTVKEYNQRLADGQRGAFEMCANRARDYAKEGCESILKDLAGELDRRALMVPRDGRAAVTALGQEKGE